MGRALWDLVRRIVSRWYAAINLISVLAWLGASYIADFQLSIWGLLAILFVVLFVSIYRAYYEQYQLLNPDVDFTLTITKCVVANCRFFDAARRFRERGEFDFFVHFEITNQRATQTEIRFETGQIDTDLPVDVNETELKLQLGSSNPATVSQSNILVLPPNRSATVNLKMCLHMLFEQPEESVRLISKATHFGVPIGAIQADGGASNHYASLDNPKEEFSGHIIKEIEHWFEHPSPQRIHASGAEIVEYLRWLFDG